MAKFADTNSIREFKDPDGDVLVLRTELAKGEADRISELQQNYVQTADGFEIRSRIREANREFFTILAQRFTINGQEQELTGDTYSKLDEASGSWVDECMSEIFRARRERRAEGKASGEQPSDSPDSPPAEDDSAGKPSTTTSDESPEPSSTTASASDTD